VTTAADTRHGEGSEVPTEVAMKSSVFWDITTCNPVKSTDDSVHNA
jgi:hypothetical protein